MNPVPCHVEGVGIPYSLVPWLSGDLSDEVEAVG